MMPPKFALHPLQHPSFCQAIGMNLEPGLLAGLSQCLDEILPVHIVEKNILAAITPACSRRLSELMMW
jgi:hypothetical protein